MASGTPHLPLTQPRIETFLRVLSETGSPDAAAAAASPHCEGPRPGYSTFRDLRGKDPEFALRWEEAVAHYVGALEKVASKWAMQGRKRPVVDKNGNIVGYDEHPPDPRIMLAVLRRHRPDDWDERKRLELSGIVDHVHSGSVFTIPFEHAVLLSPEKRALLADLVEEATHLGEQRTGNLIEHDDG